MVVYTELHILSVKCSKSKLWHKDQMQNKYHDSQKKAFDMLICWLWGGGCMNNPASSFAILLSLILGVQYSN